MAGTAQGRGGYRSALRSADLRVLLAGELVSASGTWAYNVALLAGAAEETAVRAGAVVVAEGDEADAFHAVIEGQLAVSSVGEGGTQTLRMRSLRSGSYFGEIGLLAHIPRTATVAAQTPCTLLRIAGEDFLDALTSISASALLLAGAQASLARTRPSSQALHSLLSPGNAGTASQLTGSARET